jgi:hypothetical protein
MHILYYIDIFFYMYVIYTTLTTLFFCGCVVFYFFFTFYIFFLHFLYFFTFCISLFLWGHHLRKTRTSPSSSKSLPSAARLKL